ncbi:MAG: glycogen synthase GlgA [Nitrospiria bacterium]
MAPISLGRQSRRINVIIAASEVVPYAKTGGLADVLGGLSTTLSRKGLSVVVFLPLYTGVDLQGSLLRPAGKRISVPISQRKEDGELFVHESEGVSYYFLKKDRYFARPGIYGTSEGDYPDNAERFLFFSRGVLEAIKILGIQPDIFHCHDWHTGLIPLYLKTSYSNDFQNAPSLFTIHNLGYQGIFQREAWHLFNLSEDYLSDQALQFDGRINFLKGGILYADVLSTVSLKYAEEIQTTAYGNRLEPFLIRRRRDLFGILNGLDTKEWNPANDPYIPFQYDAKRLSGKERCKASLQEEFALPIRGGTPLLAMITRLAGQKGIDLATAAIENMMKWNIQLVILGSGEKKYETVLKSLAERYPNQMAVKIAYDHSLAHRIEAGADIFLMPSQYEPCGLNQMMSLRYGTVPVVRATGGLDDTITQFNPGTLRGNGFKFKAYTPTAFLRQIRKALSLYPERKKWDALIRNGMNVDYSWETAAERYINLYRSVINKRGRE